MDWYSRYCADCSRPMDKKQKEIGKEAAYGRLILPQSGLFFCKFRNIHTPDIKS